MYLLSSLIRTTCFKCYTVIGTKSTVKMFLKMIVDSLILIGFLLRFIKINTLQLILESSLKKLGVATNTKPKWNHRSFICSVQYGQTIFVIGILFSKSKKSLPKKSFWVLSEIKISLIVSWSICWKFSSLSSIR